MTSRPALASRLAAAGLVLALLGCRESDLPVDPELVAEEIEQQVEEEARTLEEAAAEAVRIQSEAMAAEAAPGPEDQDQP